MSDELKPTIQVVAYRQSRVNLSKDISMAEVKKHAPRDAPIIAWWRQRQYAERLAAQGHEASMPDLADGV